ncbi:hypothetical protein BDV37DRAFT_259069 [Aspergillus pseudonomiae]|uniref:Uncharacterized protein n=1 Tax=Aspergillus pseudonomiae TaxID=1506151 RepID=A0A5N7D0G9_9EURO|nr:uncharacterized protein BDV37DRAFT_259069 [Aspergillus pseudonomiae]KAE8399900.1 hypothetical protein BDV37DRAFT_259069 [Aspergillus pseudonomiae]
MECASQSAQPRAHGAMPVPPVLVFHEMIPSRNPSLVIVLVSINLLVASLASLFNQPTRNKVRVSRM